MELRGPLFINDTPSKKGTTDQDLTLFARGSQNQLKLRANQELRRFIAEHCTQHSREFEWHLQLGMGAPPSSLPPTCSPPVDILSQLLSFCRHGRPVFRRDGTQANPNLLLYQPNSELNMHITRASCAKGDDPQQRERKHSQTYTQTSCIPCLFRENNETDCQAGSRISLPTCVSTY